MLSRLRLAWLGHPRMPALAALLAVGLTLPALGVGFQLDDFGHRAIMLRAPGVSTPPLGVFTSVGGEETNRSLLDLGVGLVAGTAPGELSRVDVWTLRLRQEGSLFAGPLGKLFRGSPMRVGETARVPGMTARIDALGPDGGPRAFTFRFAVSLEDPSLVWVRWQDDRYVPFRPPPVGGTIALPARRSLFESFRAAPTPPRGPRASPVPSPPAPAPRRSG